MTTLKQLPAHVVYSAVIRSGSKDEKRSADAYLQFDRLGKGARKRVSDWCNAELRNSPLIRKSIWWASGFELDRIERLRRRQSKSGLYEAVVFMRR